jgi:Cu+-exporting ATPase
MSHAPLKEVYRIDASGFTCRSVAALATLNVLEIDGVEAVTSGGESTLLAITSAERDLHDEIVRAAVRSGLDPTRVKGVDLERILDPNPLLLEEAEALGLIEPPKEPVRAVVETVQRLRVAVTDGYDPDTIIVKADIPAEIEFSEAHGCLGTVVFDGLDVEEDLEHGGAVVKLPPLEAGTYTFRCGMDMVHGTLIAE